MNVLLVEDNDRNAYLATFLLVNSGFEVERAANGPLALAMAAHKVYDLILLDIQLPGMDGYEVATSLRQLKNGAVVPIIAVTSHALVGDRERALGAGCTGYIEKPIDPETFVDDVRQHLNLLSPNRDE